MNLADKITIFIKQHARIILSIFVILSIITLLKLPELKIENTRGRYNIPEEDPVMQQFRAYENIFGASEILFIALESDKKVTADVLKKVKLMS